MLAETLDRAMQIQADSASRASKAEDGGTFSVNFVMVTHPTPSSAKETTAPTSGTRKKRRSSGKKTATAKACATPLNASLSLPAGASSASARPSSSPCGCCRPDP